MVKLGPGCGKEFLTHAFIQLFSSDMGVDNISYAVYPKNCAEVFEFQLFGLSAFQFVDVSV